MSKIIIKPVYTLDSMLSAEDRSNLWKRRALEAQLALESDRLEDEDSIVVEDSIECSPKCTYLIDFKVWCDSQEVTRQIDYINGHCTGTSPNVTATAIQNYWINKLKWKSPGYHVLVHSDGSYTVFSDLQLVTNGVRGVNSRSINVSYTGGTVDGKNLDTRTKQQKATFNGIIKILSMKFPDAEILGHRDHKGVKKSCPCFNMKDEF